MTKIICEAASSWNGEPDLLHEMIRAASENGGDIFKTQDYRADNVPDGDLDKARYQKYQMPDTLYPQFIEWCWEFEIEPLVTCFNKDRVKFLASLGLKKVKVASISMTNTELIMEAGAYFEELIVSTAMHTEEEIREAADLLASNAHSFTLMVCTANYPTLPENAHLGRINALQDILEGQEYADVGYSDHSLDLDVAKAAVAKGIKYIEKHFSLSRYLPQIPHQMYEGGPLVTTHEVSIQPHELKELSDWRHKVRKIEGGGEFLTNNEEQAIKERYQNRYGN